MTDYRYYEDPSDDFRDEEGTLMPLWKFNYDKTQKLNITDICFNTLYYDLFAVCYGSCELNLAASKKYLNIPNKCSLFFAVDFLNQAAEGCVCLFTIKNPSFPDYRSKYSS